MLILTNNSMIDFFGIEIKVFTFLLIAICLAIIIFLILLAILLIMYLKKRMRIKGYLGYDNKKYKLEDEILQIESEISQIQKRFYITRQYKKK